METVADCDYGCVILLECKAYAYNPTTNSCKFLTNITDVGEAAKDFTDGYHCYKSFRQGVVFLQHGLAGSADDWVSNEHNYHGD